MPSKEHSKGTEAIKGINQGNLHNSDPLVQQLEILQVENTGEPKVRDLKIVIEMFKDIKQDLKINKDTLSTFAQTQKDTSDEITVLRKKVKYYKAKTEVMTSAIQTLTRTVDGLQQRMTTLERKTRAPSVVITGLTVAEDKKIAKLQVEAFLEENLEITVNIVDMYHTGEAEPRSIVVCLEQENQKTEILSKKSKLKDIVNRDGKQYYINELLSAEENEKRL